MNHWTRLRWRLHLLGVVDWLLGTHFVEKTASRWRHELELMQAEITTLQARLEELNESRSAILRHLSLSYLQWRQTQSPRCWLHFDPRVSTEESAIDVLTRALVIPHWARWRITQAEDEDEDLYTYDMLPDWPALYHDALKYAASLPPGLLDWLAEQLKQKQK